MSDYLEYGLLIGVAVLTSLSGAVVAGIVIFKEFFSHFSLNNEDKQILFLHLERKNPGLKKVINSLASNLIKGKEFLKQLIEKIKILKNRDLKGLFSKPQKVFLLGDTGVGKSTLINCIEGNKLAPEAKVDAPTTLEYKEYTSQKYKNLIFCDTKGMEKGNQTQIGKKNACEIKEKSYGLNNCLFWYLKSPTNHFQEADVNYIKLIEKKLSKKIRLFMVITRSSDDVNDKDRLDQALKEYFPDKNIPIFPVYARGTGRIKSYGLEELMKESKNFFSENKINACFEKIYLKDDKLLKKFLDKSDAKGGFRKILNYFRFDEYLKKLDKEEEVFINDLFNSYSNFKENNMEKLTKLCCLIKARNEIIDKNNSGKTTKRLSNVNNTLDEINNGSVEDAILKGLDKKERDDIKSKYNEYVKDDNIKKEINKFLIWFYATIFVKELKNQIISNLVEIDGLIN